MTLRQQRQATRQALYQEARRHAALAARYGHGTSHREHHRLQARVCLLGALQIDTRHNRQRFCPFPPEHARHDAFVWERLAVVNRAKHDRVIDVAAV